MQPFQAKREMGFVWYYIEYSSHIIAMLWGFMDEKSGWTRFVGWISYHVFEILMNDNKFATDRDKGHRFQLCVIQMYHIEKGRPELWILRATF